MEGRCVSDSLTSCDGECAARSSTGQGDKGLIKGFTLVPSKGQAQPFLLQVDEDPFK